MADKCTICNGTGIIEINDCEYICECRWDGDEDEDDEEENDSVGDFWADILKEN